MAGGCPCGAGGAGAGGAAARSFSCICWGIGLFPWEYRSRIWWQISKDRNMFHVFFFLYNKSTSQKTKSILSKKQEM